MKLSEVFNAAAHVTAGIAGTLLGWAVGIVATQGPTQTLQYADAFAVGLLGLGHVALAVVFTHRIAAREPGADRP